MNQPPPILHTLDIEAYSAWLAVTSLSANNPFDGTPVIINHTLYLHTEGEQVAYISQINGSVGGVVPLRFLSELKPCIPPQMNDQTHDVLQEVLNERVLQDAKWGEQDHAIPLWIMIAVEEMGEAAQAGLQGKYQEYRQELIQLAAVAVAAVEAFDRARVG